MIYKDLDKVPVGKPAFLGFYANKALCSECGGPVKVPIQGKDFVFEKCFCMACGAVYNMQNKPEDPDGWWNEQMLQKGRVEDHPFECHFTTAFEKMEGVADPGKRHVGYRQNIKDGSIGEAEMFGVDIDPSIA